MLDAASARRLTVVCAPAGFGKSALLAEWTATLAAGRRWAWITASEQESDPTSFCMYVLHALHRAVPERVGADLLSACTPSVSFIRAVVPKVLNALL
jgi:LuxR family maltose regulon positive regulatory protein